MWTHPECNVECSDPNPIPEGYVKGTDRWECASGFLGYATSECVASWEECSSRLVLAGCAPPAPCVADGALTCMLNLTECSEMWPDSTCEAPCRSPPYLGNATTVVSCPEGNTDPARLPYLSPPEPECVPQCQHPADRDVPDGYVWEVDESLWRCAEGYIGSASVPCVVDPADCVPGLSFSGCSQLVPCAAPVGDVCRLDLSGCESVSAGSECDIHCKHPYAGVSTVGRCPEGNIDPTMALSWVEPMCEVSCSEVYMVPIGYTSHPYIMMEDGWACVHGYAGSATSNCTPSLSCGARLRFNGCEPLANCMTLKVSQAERCIYDTISCLSVPAGYTCVVRCREPYEGEAAVATCPHGNTNPLTELSWSRPACTLRCPVPDTAPAGYTNMDGVWQCAPGYTGQAVDECFSDPSCIPRLVLSGCLALQPCVVPRDAPCWLDWSDCQNVWPGSACTVRCKRPYVGNVTTMNCTADNTDPGLELFGEVAHCELTCPDPEPGEFPAGYEKPGWQCGPGYGRSASYRCVTVDDDCVPELELTGCSPLVPCTPVGLPADCAFDLSDCLHVEAGSSCEVRCRAPFYAGTPTPAFCAARNTDTMQGLLWVEPRCDLVCEDPEPIPEGYVKKESCENGWACAEGYFGLPDVHCVPGPNCSAELNFSGCVALRPCSAETAIPPELACKFNASSCTGVLPGDYCEVKCQAPYAENATSAYCPATNTDMRQPPLYEDIECGLDCPNPDVAPPGYFLNGTDWACAEGYEGEPITFCGVDPEDCAPRLQVSGCLEIVACELPEVPVCTYDFSDCASGEVAQGASCLVRCQWPFIGDTSTLFCPSRNTDPKAVVWTPPSCDLGCAGPTSMLGYEKVGGRWRCAPNYKGDLVKTTCLTTSSCIVIPSLSGCVRMESCLPLVVPPELKCLVDASDCDDVFAGDGCFVTCKFPFVGNARVASCPAGNTEIDTPMLHTFPTCSCPDPLPTPPGYWKDVADVWHCENGYGGIARASCVMSTTDCSFQPYLKLTGCLPVTACSPHPDAAVQTCRLNVTDCEPEVDNGAQCEITCLAPFTGNTTTAHCPVENTDRMRGLQYDEPPCVAPCPDPPIVPVEYAKGEWRCAEGYDGVVTTQCLNTTGCGAQLILEGCKPLVPCVAPELVGDDICTLDVDDCASGVLPGAFCVIRCKEPYDGPPTRAFCHPLNTDPSNSLVWTRPRCTVACPTEFNVPPGYYHDSACGWQCEKTYTGRASVVCRTSPKDNCVPQRYFGGCVPLQACLAPDAMFLDACQLDASACNEGLIWAGHSCEITCKAPYTGSPSLAICPADNTVVERELLWAEPPCELGCPEPQVAPQGYTRPAGEAWQCAEGFAGVVSASCVIGPGCTSRSVLTGCAPLASCLAPTLLNEGECMLDTSLCANGALAGESCEVRCRTPYSGSPSIAICPANNTDITREVVWMEPECKAQCPDPFPTPAGYVRRELSWQCSEGYVGSASVECMVDANCNAQLKFTGCALLVPCLSPVLLGPDVCAFDVSGCSRVHPNSICHVGCRAPYVGASVPAGCPADNVNPLQELSWERPNCTFACPLGDPDPVPAGYVKSANSTWQCSDGYFGSPLLDCHIDGGCVTQWSLIGCQPLVPCVRPPSDACRHAAAPCSSVAPGASCTVRCLAPFVAAGIDKVSWACPQDNIDPMRSLSLLDGSAVVPECRCPYPETMPVGYTVVGGFWRCAPGYVGDVESHCSVGEDCVHAWILEGCVEIVPCTAPDPRYVIDRSECQNIDAGMTCAVPCLPSTCVAGGPIYFRCPTHNTDPQKRPDLVDGRCRVRCMVCGLGQPFKDMDRRIGYISGTFEFGPAHAEGAVLTSGVDGYSVYFADHCEERLGAPVAWVAANGTTMQACCRTSMYVATLIDVQVPAAAAQLVVAIVTSAGELPHGIALAFTDINGSQVPVTTSLPPATSRRPRTPSSLAFRQEASALLTAGIIFVAVLAPAAVLV